MAEQTMTIDRARRLAVHRFEGELLLPALDGYPVARASGDDLMDARRVLWQCTDRGIFTQDASTPIEEEGAKDKFIIYGDGGSTEMDLDDVVAGWDGYLADPGYLDDE